MEINKISNYMLGKEFTGVAKTRRSDTALSQDEMTDILNKVCTMHGVEAAIEEVNTPKAFYEIFGYAKNVVPKEHQEEVFYVLKNEAYSPEIPAKVIFAAREAEKTGAINNFSIQFTDKELEKMFEDGYLGDGYTMHDAISSVVGHFNVITEWRPTVDALTEGFSEVYIPSQNYVACISKDVADRFSLEDIKLIEVKKGFLTIGGTKIVRMSPLVGVTDAIFDLRNTR